MSSASVTIRPATLDDCPRINEIYNHAILHTTASFHMQPVSLEYRENWFQHHGPRHPIVVAETDGKIVGWGCLSQWSERQAYDATCENSVFVDSDFQGHGIGKQLMNELIRLACTHGMHTVIARIAAGNPPSNRLHESTGFELIGTMKEAGLKFDKLIDVHIYQLML